MTVELLYLPGCPHHGAALDLVRDVLREQGWRAELTQTRISDYQDALKHGFPGSPTFRVNGYDIEEGPSARLAVGFACRTYLVDGTHRGLPPRAWLERALRAARIPEENCL